MSLSSIYSLKDRIDVFLDELETEFDNMNSAIEEQDERIKALEEALEKLMGR